MRSWYCIRIPLSLSLVVLCCSSVLACKNTPFKLTQSSSKELQKRVQEENRFRQHTRTHISPSRRASVFVRSIAPVLRADRKNAHPLVRFLLRARRRGSSNSPPRATHRPKTATVRTSIQQSAHQHTKSTAWSTTPTRNRCGRRSTSQRTGRRRTK